MGYELYVDGSFSAKRHRIGWGMVVVKDNKILDLVSKAEKLYNVKSPNMGSTRIELIAIVDAIKYCHDNNIDDANIYNDSEGLVSVFDRRAFYNWNDKCAVGRHSNSDLWKAILNLWNDRTMRVKSCPKEPDKDTYHRLSHFLSHQDANKIVDLNRVSWLVKHFEIIDNSLRTLKGDDYKQCI